MTSFTRRRLWPFAALALTGAAYGQVPASNDTSDPSGNTGMGSDTFGGPMNTAPGSFNTACGYHA